MTYSDHALSVALDRAMNAAAQMEPWSLMGRPNGTSYIMPGDQSKDAECRGVYTSRGNAERALKGWNRLCDGADKFQQILA
ncbi:hypothetical protein LRR18_18485, partial [Mangrovimonas sp. AS39]|uniref:hypothetical protein n=1 Tax=Mangrovimonas futianensis TaxID=2895523 RepID=UPI001E5553A5